MRPQWSSGEDVLPRGREGAGAGVATRCRWYGWLVGGRAEEFGRRAKHLKIHWTSMVLGSYYVEWWHFVNLFSNL